MQSCRTWLFFVFLALTLPFTNLLAHPLPGPSEAVYTATYQGMNVKARRELIANEQGFRLLSTIEGILGGMSEREDFHTDEKGRIRLDAYHAEKTFFGVNKTESMLVDQASNKAIYTRKEKRREVSMKPEYLGPVSYQLQLRHDVAAMKTLPEEIIGPDSSFTYQVLSRGKLKDYVFKLLGDEKLETPLGVINTVKLHRVRDNSDRKTIFWMAPDWEYLIVKINQVEKDGKQYEMLLETASLDGQTVSGPVATTAPDSGEPEQIK